MKKMMVLVIGLLLIGCATTNNNPCDSFAETTVIPYTLDYSDQLSQYNQELTKYNIEVEQWRKDVGLDKSNTGVCNKIQEEKFKELTKKSKELDDYLERLNKLKQTVDFLQNWSLDCYARQEQSQNIILQSLIKRGPIYRQDRLNYTTVKPNAYGLGVNMDQYGRPTTYQLQDGKPLPPIFYNGVKRDTFGPGVHMDEFGRTVYDSIK